MLFASKGSTKYWLRKVNTSVLETLWTVLAGEATLGMPGQGYFENT